MSVVDDLTITLVNPRQEDSLIKPSEQMRSALSRAARTTGCKLFGVYFFNPKGVENFVPRDPRYARDGSIVEKGNLTSREEEYVMEMDIAAKYDGLYVDLIHFRTID